MVVESWESVQANQNIVLFMQGTFCEHLQIAYTKIFFTDIWVKESRRVTLSFGPFLHGVLHITARGNHIHSVVLSA